MERVRRRYIVLELKDQGEKSWHEEWRILLEKNPSLKHPLLKLIPLHPRLVLLRCGHKQVEGLKRLLASWEGVEVLGVSGTMKGAKRKFLRDKGYP
ncbi:MAG: hypothetical protein DSO03_00650 [Hadesarchaea archaeon]|nr:MAG: hypothetical protein DSO03_00650 [Hadesarchaea archaeon]